MGLKAFAQKFKLDEEWLYALPFPEFCGVIGRYGYTITGLGIIPDPKAKPQTQRKPN